MLNLWLPYTNESSTPTLEVYLPYRVGFEVHLEDNHLISLISNSKLCLSLLSS